MIISGDDIPQNLKTHDRSKSTRRGAARHATQIAQNITAGLRHARRAVLVCGLPGSGKSTHAAKIDRAGLLVIDTCAATSRARQRIAGLCAAAGVPVDCVMMRASAETLTARRPKVPASVYARMAGRVSPPKKSEGFGRVCYIYTDDGEGDAAQAENNRS